MIGSAAYFDSPDLRECATCGAYLADYFGQPNRARSCGNKCLDCCPCESCMDVKNDDGCETCVRCGIRTDDFVTYSWGNQCAAYFACAARMDAKSDGGR